MPTATPNLGLLIYSTSEYLTLFRNFWHTVNFTGSGTIQDPYSAFQLIDNKVGELNTRMNNLEPAIENAFAATMLTILEASY